ncbi:MAG TPA: MFS transporter [Candidatus Dormibacteraeota bacterium]|nr:MFS transporter [Candidatus Dormibacteraeota bacterium]
MALTHGAAPPVPARAQRPWGAQLGVLWAGQSLTVMGSSFVMPFLPIMVANTGVSGSAVALWTGALTTLTQTGMAIFSPIWGRIADHTGRKPMMVRAIFGAGITTVGIALAPNVYVMVVLFFARGALAGIVSAGAALVTTMAPAERVAHSLGVLQSSLYIGSTAGPAIGAVLIPLAGLRSSFLIAGALQLVASLMVARYVEERFVREDAAARRGRARGRRGLRDAGVAGTVGVLLMMGLLAQAVASGFGATMPLRVRSLASPQHLAVAVGVIAALQASGAAVSALMIGRMGRRAGYRKVLVASSVWAMLICTALVLTPSLVLIGLLASLIGLALGAFVPAVNTLLGRVSPPAMRAEVFGYAGTAFALGGLVAPITCTSLIAGTGSTAAPFALLAGLELLAAVWAARSLQRLATVRG